MKKTSSVVAGILAVAALTGTAVAAPYASLIRISDTTIATVPTSEFPVNITYRLNEAADSVSIVVKNSSNATVATFAGTATAGANTVAWNGTADNASGAAVVSGAGYKIEITANRNAAAGFTFVAGSGSAAADYPTSTLFTGFSPRDTAVPTNTNSDLFGYVLAASSFIGPPAHSAHVVLTSDLKTAAADDGFASRTLAHPRDPLGAAPGATASGTTWGTTFIPGTDVLLASGQTGATGATTNPAYTYALNTGGVLSSALLNADPDGVLASYVNPRDLAVSVEGAKTYVYITHANATIAKVEYDTTANKYIGTPFNVLALTQTTGYSKSVVIDANGNLYFLMRSGGTTGGSVLRWSAAQIAAITADGDPKLTEANAQWNVTAVDVTFNATVGNWIGLGIDATTGNVYMIGATSESAYLIDNTANASVVKTISAADLAINFATNTRTVGVTYGAATFDIAGNLINFDPGPERIDYWSKGGNTSVTIPAPTSQTFSITNTAKVADWSNY